mgnify:CR=1 FL=1
MKLQVGTPVLVVGPFLHEKAEVIKAEKGVYTLNNQLKISRDFKVLVKSEFTCKPFDQAEYDYLQAKSMLTREIDNLKNYPTLSQEDTIRLYEKIKKLNDKFFGGKVCKF